MELDLGNGAASRRAISPLQCYRAFMRARLFFFGKAFRE
jgi:hypothetical protein